MWRSDAASIAPVFPADTTASASPAPTARQARTSEESGFARTASAGFSCISSMPSLTTSSSPRVSSRGRAEEHRADPVGRGLERAGHDLVRRAVASQSVDRDPDRHVERYGAGARSGSTSRSRYVLHVGQTWCGRFGWPQVGQTLTRGARCRAGRGACLCGRSTSFFFGTAMSGCAV